MDVALPAQSPTIKTRLKRFIIVFLLYFLTAVASQYFFHTFQTSPAVFWPPVGLAFGFLFIWGVEEAFPIALAQLFAALTNPSHPSIALAITGAIAYTLQSVFGVYALKKFRFSGSMTHTFDAISLLLVALIFPAIAPIIITVTAHFTRELTVPFWENWSRSWAGGILSTILITPFITSWSWLSNSRAKLKDVNVIESSLAMLLLAIVTYVLYWTKLPAANSFILIYAFFGAFFWIGLRLQPRMMTLGLLFSTMLGIAGTIIAHPTTTPLSTQLFADELFIVLVAPIFLILSVVATERSVAVKEFAAKTNELAMAMEKLSSEDRSKNEFITILAHELRNPLAPIASTLEYLKLNESDPENLKAVEVAEQQMRIVRRLLDDLLDVGRITQKKFRVQREVVALNAILQPAITAVTSFYQSRNQHFSVLMPNTTIYLKADPARMVQAVMNLLFNAGKYTPPGGTIELTAEQQDNFILISIKDNGIGISPEALPLIFKPFHQASREAEVGTGLGLGLFITKQLVEMHEGKITAFSEGANQGTTLFLRLPVMPSPERTSLPTAPQPSHQPAPGSRTFHILLVDDNEAAAQTLKKLLTLHGHTVTLAFNGESALKAVAEHKPDVVILDIGLPDMDGYAVARAIRESGVKLLLIALTGYGQQEDLLKAQSAGFDHHFTKPVGLSSIESALNAFSHVQQ